jgi:hypothetical protein
MCYTTIINTIRIASSLTLELRRTDPVRCHTAILVVIRIEARRNPHRLDFTLWLDVVGLVATLIATLIATLVTIRALSFDFTWRMHCISVLILAA